MRGRRARHCRRPAALLVLVLAATGCGVPTDADATFAGPDDVPFDLLDPDTAPSPPTPVVPGATVEVCLRLDDHLVPVSRPAPTTSDGAEALLDLVRADPTDAERERGLQSALPSDDVVASASVAAGIAQVELGAAYAAASDAERLLAVAEIVCTLTSQSGIGQVSFTTDGTHVEVPRADGSLTTGPVSRDDYAALIET